MLSVYGGNTWDNYTLKQGSPAPGLQTGTGLQPVRNRAAQQEVSGEWSFICCSPSLALLPELSPLHHPVMEKLSSMKPVPGAKMFGDCCFKRQVGKGT